MSRVTLNALHIKTLHHHIVPWNHIMSLKMKDKLFLEITHQMVIVEKSSVATECINAIQVMHAASYR